MTTKNTLTYNIPCESDDVVCSKLGPMSPLIPVTVPCRPRNTTQRVSAFHNYKRPKLDSPPDNDKVSGVTTDVMKDQRSSSWPPMGKTKTYMMPPMDNPEDEKKRKNAIIARKNRVLKKKESQALMEKAQKLEETMREYCGAMQRLEEDLQAHRNELRRVDNIVIQLQADKFSLQTSLQAQMEKLSFIREHIRLINETMDESNPIQKLLTVLMERITSFSPSPFASPSPVSGSSPHAGSPQRVISPPRLVSSPYITSLPRNTS